MDMETMLMQIEWQKAKEAMIEGIIETRKKLPYLDNEELYFCIIDAYKQQQNGEVQEVVKYRLWKAILKTSQENNCADTNRPRPTLP